MSQHRTPTSTQTTTQPLAKPMNANDLIHPATQGKIIFFAIIGTFAIFVLIFAIALIYLLNYWFDTVLPYAISVLKPLTGTLLRAVWNVRIPLPLSLLPCCLMLVGLWYFGLLARGRAR